LLRHVFQIPFCFDERAMARVFLNCVRRHALQGKVRETSVPKIVDGPTTRHALTIRDIEGL